MTAHSNHTNNKSPYQFETKGKADDTDRLVSKRLKLRRILLGFSQKELSDAVSVSIQQIQKYENATNRISCGKLLSFAKFLNVPVNYFFSQSNEPEERLTSMHFFAEDPTEYNGQYEANDQKQKALHATDKEMITLVKAFNDIKSTVVRRKLVELIRLLS
jgi:transcriptional regulator with XRE-family HTH domain